MLESPPARAPRGGAPSWRAPWRWLARDIQGRLRCYRDDWRQGISTRVLAPSLYIFLASVLPALAFGAQLTASTEGTLTVVHVLASTAIAGVVQSLIGGQPLLIIGVAEPIVIIYGFCFEFAKGQDGLGAPLFLPWAAWICVWTALMVLALALAGTCSLIHLFTRFSGETFGMLIAVLFVQVGVKGLISEFRPLPPSPSPDPAATSSTGGAETQPGIDGPWLTVNGLWAVLLGAGLLLSCLALARARGWRFLVAWARRALADYAAALMVAAWTGLSYALRDAPAGVPRRVLSPDPSQVTSSWTVAERMGEVPGAFIAAALVPALLIALLFWFDHNVSSQMAQQPEFDLVKPSAYHWDFLVLAGLTLTLGLLGLPPVNGVLPQAPMHTRSLSELKPRAAAAAPPPRRKDASVAEPEDRQIVYTTELPPCGPEERAARVVRHTRQPAHARGAGEDAAAPSPPPGSHPQRTPPRAPAPDPATPLASAASAPPPWAQRHGGNEPPPGARLSVAEAAAGVAEGAGAASEREGTSEGAEGEVMVECQVLEQRVSNLLQSLGCVVALAAAPAIRCIPTGVLWGYFLFMAAASLPGSQFWERLLLLATDPRRRPALLRRAHAAFLQTVPFRVTAAFTLLQLAYLLGVWALTAFAGVAGVLFPLPIILLVPLRRYILPHVFSAAELAELDRAEYEAVPALTKEGAAQVATLPAAPAPSPRDDEERAVRHEFQGLQIVHHVSPETAHERAERVMMAAHASPRGDPAGVAAPPGSSPRAAAGLRHRGGQGSGARGVGAAGEQGVETAGGGGQDAGGMPGPVQPQQPLGAAALARCVT